MIYKLNYISLVISRDKILMLWDKILISRDKILMLAWIFFLLGLDRQYQITFCLLRRWHFYFVYQCIFCGFRHILLYQLKKKDSLANVKF